LTSGGSGYNVIHKKVHYGELMTAKYRAPTVKKAFQILKLISDAEQGMRLSELSKGLKISKSTVHGIAAALEQLGAIGRDPLTKRYTLGFTLFELGRAAFSRIDLKDMARPVMEDLMERGQESVFLGIKNGEHVTILDIVETRHDLKITASIGMRIPLLAGAVGKVFLSSMPETQAIELIRASGIHKFTEKTITDPEQYLQEIRTVRKKGYATDDEEYISGVRAVASVIPRNDQPHSAIWVVGFKPSMGDDKIKFLIQETKKAAEAIRRRIEERSAYS
ncbi:MAG: IclR family transcriptional regulator, partial [Desulfobacterales bacterium]